MKKALIQKWELALIMGLILTIGFSFLGFASKCENVRDSVLRLHIKANSDSEEDQALKLKVRDRIIADSAIWFTESTTLEDAEKQVYDSLPLMQQAAEEEVKAAGYDYSVEVIMGEQYFETRHYNDVTLPAGVYDSVIVNIGAAQGQNWWCVMFPPMCLPAADEHDELSKVIDEEDVEVFESYEDYEFKFKSVEMYEEFKQKHIN